MLLERFCNVVQTILNTKTAKIFGLRPKIRKGGPLRIWMFSIAKPPPPLFQKGVLTRGGGVFAKGGGATLFSPAIRNLF